MLKRKTASVKMIGGRRLDFPRHPGVLIYDIIPVNEV